MQGYSAVANHTPASICEGTASTNTHFTCTTLNDSRSIELRVLTILLFHSPYLTSRVVGLVKDRQMASMPHLNYQRSEVQIVLSTRTWRDSRTIRDHKELHDGVIGRIRHDIPCIFPAAVRSSNSASSTCQTSIIVRAVDQFISIESSFRTHNVLVWSSSSRGVP